MPLSGTFLHRKMILSEFHNLIQLVSVQSGPTSAMCRSNLSSSCLISSRSLVSLMISASSDRPYNTHTGRVQDWGQDWGQDGVHTQADTVTTVDSHVTHNSYRSHCYTCCMPKLISMHCYFSDFVKTCYLKQHFIYLLKQNIFTDCCHVTITVVISYLCNRAKCL